MRTTFTALMTALILSITTIGNAQEVCTSFETDTQTAVAAGFTEAKDYTGVVAKNIIESIATMTQTPDLTDRADRVIFRTNRDHTDQVAMVLFFKDCMIGGAFIPREIAEILEGREANR